MGPSGGAKGREVLMTLTDLEAFLSGSDVRAPTVAPSPSEPPAPPEAPSPDEPTG